MKINTIRWWMLMLLPLALLATVSCKKDSNPSGDPAGPIVTEKGIPKGEAVTALIGTEGGSITSADGHLTIEIPEGALSAATSIGIQPVSNNAPLGLGNAYRLQPEGTTFGKPVKLIFHYDNALLRDAPEDFLWIVTQSADGVWNAMLNSQLDKANANVFIEVTHFSDWALGRFIDFSLTPSSATLRKGQSVSLKVFGFVRDQHQPDDLELVPLVPITGNGDDLTPLTPIPATEERLMDFKVTNWALNGSPAPVNGSSGKLSASGNNATYTAPDNRPSINPVAVSVRLQAKDKAGNNKVFMLNSNISIVDSDYYLLLTVDGVTHAYYQYGFNGAVPPDPNDIKMVNCAFTGGQLQIAAGEAMSNGNYLNGFVLDFNNPSETSRSLVGFHQDGEDDMWFGPQAAMGYTLNYPERVYDEIHQICNYEYKTAEVTVSIIRWYPNEHVVTGYFSGVLYEDKDGYADNCTMPDKHTIEGEFNLYPVIGKK